MHLWHSAAKNYVNSKGKKIKNFGKPYYYCSKKAVPVGVKVGALSPADLAVYDDKCDFYLPPVPV
jgi:hypothetical protein